VSSILPDSLGGLWIVHDEGVTHRSIVGWRSLRFFEELPSPAFSFVPVSDRTGGLWFYDPAGLGAIHVAATDYSVRTYEGGPGRVVLTRSRFPPWRPFSARPSTREPCLPLVTSEQRPEARWNFCRAWSHPIRPWSTARAVCGYSPATPSSGGRNWWESFLPPGSGLRSLRIARGRLRGERRPSAV
jgi:hypothetical protein